MEIRVDNSIIEMLKDINKDVKTEFLNFLNKVEKDKDVLKKKIEYFRSKGKDDTKYVFRMETFTFIGEMEKDKDIFLISEIFPKEGFSENKKDLEDQEYDLYVSL